MVDKLAEARKLLEKSHDYEEAMEGNYLMKAVSLIQEYIEEEREK